MKRKFQRWRCHYCGRCGHIRPFCFRLYGYPDQKVHAPIRRQQWVPKAQNVPIIRQQWVPKVSALIAHNSPRISAKEVLFCDSGCPKNMTEIKILKSHSSNCVTLRDEAKFDEKAGNERVRTDDTESELDRYEVVPDF